ncbi:hypothetical protein T265_11450 [Opisthorchis viverrini]|uniref:Reverse transcriptase domain-containing protein n=1 Tax=Opisthorchis viverrini TaxID=6198 RepID=A0A074YYL2_OPIVI|nr:hypothetical protein T265_11450 [Opisthorchis viverrini]KER19886.1 hypothetical protein T265_11450 [Opisthorchis viverrini]
MDFLKKLKASIDFNSGQITQTKPNQDTRTRARAGSRTSTSPQVHEQPWSTRSSLTAKKNTNRWTQSFVDRSPAPPEAKHGLMELLNEFSNSFDTHGSKLGRTHILQHTIDTGHHHTIYQTPRRIPIHYRAKLDAMIQEMLGDGISRPSSSP